MNNFTIEDCIEMLAGYSAMANGFSLDKDDATVVKSIGRQVIRGTALTDRQLALMQEKLKRYKTQFREAGIDISECLNNLRQPLRTIDRSKSIKIVESSAGNLNGTFIEVKFPFKKSDASDLGKLSEQSNERVLMPKPSHYYFAFTELNVKLLLDFYINKPSFSIDDRLITLYKKITDMLDSKNSVIPQVCGTSLINVHPRAVNNAINEIGPLTDETRIKYIDRRLRYGIVDVDYKEPNSLIEKIAYRKRVGYSSKINEEPIEDLLSALLDLDRLPLLVILKKCDAARQLEEITNFFAGKIPTSQQSVLFRTDGTKPKFNELVQERNLNNWVDKNTKVVYVADKLPKVLVKSQWKPVAALEHTGFIMDGKLAHFTSYYCDLVVYREEQESLFRKHSKHYANM